MNANSHKIWVLPSFYKLKGCQPNMHPPPNTSPKRTPEKILPFERSCNPSCDICDLANYETQLKND